MTQLSFAILGHFALNHGRLEILRVRRSPDLPSGVWEVVYGFENPSLGVRVIPATSHESLQWTFDWIDQELGFRPTGGALEGHQLADKLIADFEDEGGSMVITYTHHGVRPGWLIGYEFGREDEDSPMAGGAAYGTGETFDEAWQEILGSLRL